MKKHLFGLGKAMSLIALVIGMGLASGLPAHAATINVGCNVTELVNAINTANVNADADTMELAANCTYTLTTVNNTDATLGSNGLPVITSNLTINGNDATIARDASAPAFRLWQLSTAADVKMNHISLRGGQAGTGPHNETFGGGIYNDGVLVCTNCVLSENAAGVSDLPAVRGMGGAIYNNGTLTLTDSTISQNHAGDTVWNDKLHETGSAGHGGGIYNAGSMNMVHSSVSNNRAGIDIFAENSGIGGGIFNAGVLHLDNSTLESNNAGSGEYGAGEGGALFNDNGTVSLTESMVLNNSTLHGALDGGSCGGISSIGGTLTITRSTFSGNGAEAGGGAICSSSALTITDSVFSGNSGSGGGAIDAESGVIQNSTFSGNSASIIPSHCHCIGGYGGAIRGQLLIINSTFYGNNAARSGGAIYGSAALKVVNSTFYGNNAAGSGGAIHGSAALKVVNSTIANNTAFHEGGVYGGKAINTVFANNNGGNCDNVADGGGNIRFPETDTSCVGAFRNPKLGPLQDNGGATLTLALAPDSAAINAAVDAKCPATDQRGITRPQGKHCDSGAFELEPPTASTLIAPTDNKKLNQSQVNLKWNPAQHVAWYRVVVNQNAVNGPKVVNVKMDTTRFKTPALESGHWYYWRVQACSKVACTTSNVWRFRVK